MANLISRYGDFPGYRFNSVFHKGCTFWLKKKNAQLVSSYESATHNQRCCALASI